MNLFSNSKPLSEESDEQIRQSIREIQLKQLERLRKRSKLGAVLKPSELAAVERLEIRLFGQRSEPEESDKDDSHILSTIEDVGTHYAKSPRTIKRWISSGMPVLPGHRYDITQIDTWLLNRGKKQEADEWERVGKRYKIVYD